MSADKNGLEPTGMEKMLVMQQDLMDKVPHDLRPDSYVKMAAGVKIIDTLLRYLNSTGHKPWRPIPLSQGIQDLLIVELVQKARLLQHIHSSDVGVDEDFGDQAHYQRQLVSAFGIIEETLEYMDALVTKTRAEQLEELVDILFFYMEQAILGGFTWEEIEEEYVRKHAVNLKRYEDAAKGDYSWDKRSEGGL